VRTTGDRRQLRASSENDVKNRIGWERCRTRLGEQNSPVQLHLTEVNMGFAYTDRTIPHDATRMRNRSTGTKDQRPRYVAPDRWRTKPIDQRSGAAGRSRRSGMNEPSSRQQRGGRLVDRKIARTAVHSEIDSDDGLFKDSLAERGAKALHYCRARQNIRK